MQPRGKQILIVKAFFVEYAASLGFDLGFLGEVKHARSYWSQSREMMQQAHVPKITIILLVIELFYRACLTTLIPAGRQWAIIYFSFLFSIFFFPLD